MRTVSPWGPSPLEASLLASPLLTSSHNAIAAQPFATVSHFDLRMLFFGLYLSWFRLHIAIAKILTVLAHDLIVHDVHLDGDEVAVLVGTELAI